MSHLSNSQSKIVGQSVLRSVPYYKLTIGHRNNDGQFIETITISQNELDATINITKSQNGGSTANVTIHNIDVDTLLDSMSGLTGSVAAQMGNIVERNWNTISTNRKSQRISPLDDIEIEIGYTKGRPGEISGNVFILHDTSIVFDGIILRKEKSLAQVDNAITLTAIDRGLFTLKNRYLANSTLSKDSATYQSIFETIINVTNNQIDGLSFQDAEKWKLTPIIDSSVKYTNEITFNVAKTRKGDTSLLDALNSLISTASDQGHSLVYQIHGNRVILKRPEAESVVDKGIFTLPGQDRVVNYDNGALDIKVTEDIKEKSYLTTPKTETVSPYSLYTHIVDVIFSVLGTHTMFIGDVYKFVPLYEQTGTIGINAQLISVTQRYSPGSYVTSGKARGYRTGNDLAVLPSIPETEPVISGEEAQELVIEDNLTDQLNKFVNKKLKRRKRVIADGVVIQETQNPRIPDNTEVFTVNASIRHSGNIQNNTFEANEESLMSDIPVLTSYAGPGYGILTPIRAGSKVLLVMNRGREQDPVLIGQVFAAGDAAGVRGDDRKDALILHHHSNVRMVMDKGEFHVFVPAEPNDQSNDVDSPVTGNGVSAEDTAIKISITPNGIKISTPKEVTIEGNNVNIKAKAVNFTQG